MGRRHTHSLAAGEGEPVAYVAGIRAACMSTESGIGSSPSHERRALAQYRTLW